MFPPTSPPSGCDKRDGYGRRRCGFPQRSAEGRRRTSVPEFVGMKLITWLAATAALAAARVYRNPGDSDMPLEQRKVLITGGARASDCCGGAGTRTGAASRTISLWR